MEQKQSITKNSRRKGAHLTFEERVIIQTRKKDGYSSRKIAREIGCSHATVLNELKRGKVLLYNGRVEHYRAQDGQAQYEANRENCGRKNKALQVNIFLKFVLFAFIKFHWSLDVCFGFALKSRLFTRENMICTKTLYNYVNLGLLGKIRNIDLRLKVRRKNKWQILKLADKKATTVLKAFGELFAVFVSEADKVFKSLTTDNGSEFASLSELEKVSNILVYYAHPYTSWEKGSVENHNGLFRRFIPKGKNISDYSFEYMARVVCWANTLPRKMIV